MSAGSTRPGEASKTCRSVAVSTSQIRTDGPSPAEAGRYLWMKRGARRLVSVPSQNSPSCCRHVDEFNCAIDRETASNCPFGEKGSVIMELPVFRRHRSAISFNRYHRPKVAIGRIICEFHLRGVRTASRNEPRSASLGALRIASTRFSVLQRVDSQPNTLMNGLLSTFGAFLGVFGRGFCKPKTVATTNSVIGITTLQGFLRRLRIS